MEPMGSLGLQGPHGILLALAVWGDDYGLQFRF